MGKNKTQPNYGLIAQYMGENTTSQKFKAFDGSSITEKDLSLVEEFKKYISTRTHIISESINIAYSKTFIKQLGKYATQVSLEQSIHEILELLKQDKIYGEELGHNFYKITTGLFNNNKKYNISIYYFKDDNDIEMLHFDLE